MRPALAAAMWVGFVAAAAGTLLSLWQASATMADVPLFDSGPRLWAVFAGTSYGRFGLASLALLAAGAALHRGAERYARSHACRAALPCIVVLLAVCRVQSGHAAAGDALSMAAAVELVHVLSMALWLGTVLVAAWVVLPVVAASAASAAPARYLALLSHWATIALAGVLTTGLYNALRVLNAPAELVRTEYGWVLTTKLCLAGAAMALGGWNRFVGFPAAVAAGAMPLAAGKNLRAISAVLRIESIVLLVVLVAAAILGASAPPASP